MNHQVFVNLVDLTPVGPEQHNKRAHQRKTAHKALTSLVKAQSRSSYELTVKYDDRGAPYVTEHGSPIGFCSISHSGQKVLVAWSDAIPVGIDIEIIKPRNFKALSGEILTSEELKRFPVDNHSDFYRLFCAKEAWSKCHRQSLIYAMKMALFIDPTKDEQTLASGEHIQFSQKEQYQIALCLSHSADIYWH